MSSSYSNSLSSSNASSPIDSPPLNSDVKEFAPNDNSLVEVVSNRVQYTDDEIVAEYDYEQCHVIGRSAQGRFRVKPTKTKLTLRTKRNVGRVGVMFVGWGGNNGSTLTGGIIANRDNVCWNTKSGLNKPNYYGSMTQSSTMKIGTDSFGEEVYVALKDVLPMVNPNDLVIGGWDISADNLGDAMRKAEVLDFALQEKLYPTMAKLAPLPGIYDPDFIAANQSDRANNVMKAATKQEQMEQIRRDIRDFKRSNNLDKVVLLWTANTERFCDITKGLNDTAANLLKSIERNEKEVSPSTLYAVASILEGCSYINGSPQNTFVPGCVELAEKHGVFIAGDDFKTGQTKIKSVLMDFLVNAGIKPVSIVSYNHLGNNDGKNLSAPQQFRSKEISKSNVVDDMVRANHVLYDRDTNEHPDHCVVIKYVPYVKDSKRAMDEYTSEIFLNGHNTIVMHNTCEDSLLAAPLILDLVILTELMERITYKTEQMVEFERFDSILSILSYLLKAPLVPKNTPVVNALFRQRACIENVFRACLGLPAESHMLLEYKMKGLVEQAAPTLKAMALKRHMVDDEKTARVSVPGH